MGSQSKVQKMFNDSNHTSRQFKIGAFVSSMFGLRRYIKLTREQRKNMKVHSKEVNKKMPLECLNKVARRKNN